MLFHAVLFNFKSDVTEEHRGAILQAARDKLTPIPGVLHLLAGKSIIPGSPYAYAITMYFADGNPELQAYRAHPDHEYFRDVTFFPFLENKLGLDYEC
jgi:hypothetical protein